MQRGEKAGKGKDGIPPEQNITPLKHPSGNILHWYGGKSTGKGNQNVTFKAGPKEPGGRDL